MERTKCLLAIAYCRPILSTCPANMTYVVAIYVVITFNILNFLTNQIYIKLVWCSKTSVMYIIWGRIEPQESIICSFVRVFSWFEPKPSSHMTSTLPVTSRHPINFLIVFLIYT